MRKIFLVLMLLFATIWFISCGSDDGDNNNNNNETYKISFDGNGGSKPSDESGKNGDIIKLPSSNQGGYLFNGWYTSKTGGTYKGKFDDNYEIKGNAVLYAQWTATGQTTSYTVKFNSNGGTTVNSMDVKSGDKINKPANPTKNGYNFDAWYKESSLQNIWNFTSDVVNSNITLYAKWTAGSVLVDPDAIGKLHTNITASTFWAGEGAGAANGNISNVPSAWDPKWGDHYTIKGQAKEDKPFIERDNDFIPVGYDGTENLYYFALPYNDGSSIVYDGIFEKDANPYWKYDEVLTLNPKYEKGDLYGKYVVFTNDFNENTWRKNNASNIPWFKGTNWSGKSIVKGRWIRVRSYDRGAKGNWVYAQWLDAGPYHYDDFDYIFGDARPRNEDGKPGAKSPFAGIDLSPAVIFKMGVPYSEMDAGGINLKVEWEFVDSNVDGNKIPDGPWKKYMSDNKTAW